METERLLDDLYKSEIVFQIGKEEVEFIQTGIETLVQIIADLIWKKAYVTIENETEDVMSMYPGFNISRNGKYVISDIIKAGSFYEHTKNVFPDQFDFIFLMCVFECEQFVENESKVVGTSSELHNIVREILSPSDLAFPSLTEKKRYIRFDRYLVRKGPATKLRFIYGCNNIEKYIYVDFVPAFKVLISDQKNHHVDKCEITGFSDEIKTTGSIVLVQKHVSFVETELHFMKNILSRKHVKTYRILKYILNGCYNDAHIRNKSKSDFWSVFEKCTPRLVSSYHMKRVVISHHYKCMTCSCNGVVSCLLEMFEDLKDIQCIASVKKLYEIYLERPFTVNGYRIELLDSTIAAFKEMTRRQTRTKHNESHNLNTSQVKPSFPGALPTKTIEGKYQHQSSKQPDSYQEGDPYVMFLEMPLRNTCVESYQKENKSKCSKEHINILHLDPRDSSVNYHSKENNDKTDYLISTRFQISEHNVLPSEQPLLNKESNHMKENENCSTKLNSIQKADPQETPLIKTAVEKDELQERTKASDWIKTVNSYLSNLVLIAMSLGLAIFVLYVLSYRS